MISVGTNTLYDWWLGERRTIQIISHGEVVRLSPHTEEIYSRSQNPRNCWKFSFNDTNVFEHGNEIYFYFLQWKDRQPTK